VRKILSKREFADRIGRSIRHLERLISVGQGPPLVKLGIRAVGIDEGDGEAWIAARRKIPAGWDETAAA
jgi:predicted DNA-binding transcriptional regulator AlpA